ncbi:helix-turn-helix domain-containing protein [Roseovarius rhodophyticola]|uniref:AraC family transcriptional regulator n=1 Tax=Roseovarius rhodophyticola TaxID=3080827 RepID=A0ABZ2TE48_9RHOB|nr:AraC family transcriptional regulator [Roseovarius sp. W115]MDV2928210.1 AraC family transcriptional regulator [Roseovarius sp. W115]
MMDPTNTRHAQLKTLAQWVGGAPWRATLPHSRDTHALIWITRGQGRCLLGGRRRGLSVHSAVIIPAHTLFALEPGAQSFGLVCDIPTKSSILMPDEPMVLRIRDPRAQAELTTLMETMQRDQNEARPFWDEALNAHASLITVWLRRAIIAQDEAALPRETASDRLLSAYAALIERDYATGRSMQDYARRLGVTPTHLTRTCKSAVGMTASDLLTRRILYGARDLLETTDLPANQIAARMGFRSAAYFTRFIQRHTGKSPTELRSKLAKV